MSLFDTPLRDITFDDVVRFCETFPEGVRVEYKREPANIPKVISSFANTVGGIWLIGVETDKANNMPILPLAGMPRAAGVEERIVQSAQTGIYPAITPTVRVLDVPGQPDRMIAVVKVPESIEAPHAIENSTRVYVRVGSTTPPYELAHIDRIEYFLNRRQEPERRREEAIAEATKRSPFGEEHPRVRVIVAPVYPYGILISLDDLFERASLLEQQMGWQYLTGVRRIHGGIMSSRTTNRHVTHHLVVDTHGIVFFEIPSGFLLRQTEEGIRYVHLGEILYRPAGVLNHALQLLRGGMTNVLIRYELVGWAGISFLPEFKGKSLLDTQSALERYKCVDDRVAVSTYATLESLPERRIEALTDLMQQVLLAFDYTHENLQHFVGETLRANRLI